MYIPTMYTFHKLTAVSVKFQAINNYCNYKSIYKLIVKINILYKFIKYTTLKELLKMDSVVYYEIYTNRQDNRATFTSVKMSSNFEGIIKKNN